MQNLILSPSPEIAKQIEARLSEFVTATTPDLGELRQIAAALGALPLIQGLGGGYAIRPDGEIISFPWDDPSDVQVENDVRMRNMALYQGSKEYPELSVLIPSRPPDALECPYCKGTGTVADLPADFKFREYIVCYCGGLGWLPGPES